MAGLFPPCMCQSHSQLVCIEPDLPEYVRFSNGRLGLKILSDLFTTACQSRSAGSCILADTRGVQTRHSRHIIC